MIVVAAVAAPIAGVAYLVKRDELGEFVARWFLPAIVIGMVLTTIWRRKAA